ncbi:FAD-dependent monooxygenase [Rurimicrobium arvi]|uniref:FAD-dependent monooxygenase n=1 Tax=Rurimicrobium arvi TaxID=2049916 RepID=A0ABP8MFY5_9BACT
MTQQIKRVLISGASFAGLTAAYWMNRLGYQVTVAETAPFLKMGGTPVDIKDDTVDIMRRMGLLDAIKANRIGPEKWEFKNADDVTELCLQLEKKPDNEFEIERDLLLHMLYDLVKDEVRFLFGNSISTMTETTDGMEVQLRDGMQEQFHLVLGCDGVHSPVRRLWFGPEEDFVHFPGQYFAIAIVNKLLIPEGCYQLYAEPDKGVALYAYNKKTDIIFTFRPETEISYDFRNSEQQQQIIREQFAGVRWRTPELLQELLQSRSFYFDRFCQVKMARWARGRVVLAGDAAYCASPAAGMGGSLAIIGATALCDAFATHGDDLAAVFDAYDRQLRPFIDQVQAEALLTLDKLLPRTEEEIRLRNNQGF